MKFRDPKSIIIIAVFVVMNSFIIWKSFTQVAPGLTENQKAKALAPEFTLIEQLDYFHLKDGIPQMSLAAASMRSIGEEQAEFEFPKGVYNYQEKNKTLRYQAEAGIYKKENEVLKLTTEVKVTTDEAEYLAQKVIYYFKKDLILGSGGVRFNGEDLKTRDQVTIAADSMRANPNNKYTHFKGKVEGALERKKKYEGRLIFSSESLELEGQKSMAHLLGDVRIKRSNYLITAGKADLHMQNFNKSLKYFVLNDDVKMTETMETPKGITKRNAFSERLEGFGREQKMVLTGAPRVEQGKDVIKGYRITVRENIDLIEVDDAMSDVQVKRKKELKD
ncbi:MAG TPA: LptA/OstA family protein [Bacteriovoracaceae bacterium]|nr:LptA/OstA family protein [Bacteriovoracaceae bacterium]